MKLKVTFTDNGMINKQVLTELFGAYGPIENLKIFRGVNPTQQQVLAFVEMENEQDGFIALQLLQGIEVGGTRLKISVSYDQVHGMDGSILSAPKKKVKPIEEEIEDEDEDSGDTGGEEDDYNYQSDSDWGDDKDDYDRQLW